ncbi:MAG: hypothetical protein PF693_05735 [Spirochaetia bacterium]|jgi:transposase|nr:hypothetical protein [Spirochaetia bacterium]
MKYSTGFRNNVIKKVLPPENKSIAEVSKETGVSDRTIRNWLFKLKMIILVHRKGKYPRNKGVLQKRCH